MNNEFNVDFNSIWILDVLTDNSKEMSKRVCGETGKVYYTFLHKLVSMGVAIKIWRDSEYKIKILVSHKQDCKVKGPFLHNITFRNETEYKQAIARFIGFVNVYWSNVEVDAAQYYKTIGCYKHDHFIRYGSAYLNSIESK